MFQQSVIQTHLVQQNATEIAQKYQQFCAIFHNADKQANIRASKEEQYQEGFLNDLFVQILGYTLNPNPNYNLITEQKNTTNSKKADGAIWHNQQIIAVIELKGMDTVNLDTIVAQAFGYKNNHAHCRYVIIANFQKLRFYIQNTTEYVEFNLFHLSETEFSLLYLLLQHNHLTSGLPEKLKAQSLSAEEAITKQLYADYSAFKRDLFADLIAQNPQHDKLALFQKSQKLLDRFLFIFFAEDCRLLPPNAILEIVQNWEKLKQLDAYIPLYDRMKQYFGWLNEGNADKNIFAYNGGLFKPDDTLDALKISDGVLEKHCTKIAQYDFSSQIDVNILGHIFEHSLNEIDEIHAELRGEIVDKKQTKRKKDGVFYTPKYITQYIVQNTVGKLCADKKAELGLTAEYLSGFRLPEKATKAALAKYQQIAQEPLQKMEDYRQWLLDLAICDPACGSGAFLNEALNFLIAEHTQLDEMQSQLAGSSMVFQNVEHAILERNLYGVDINPESVEIAKLSLWLRTAQRHRKLNNLNNNIVCGNSLIDGENVSGSLKPFSWQNAFPQVFERGGFDVIIGNPPYVKLEQIKEASQRLEKVGFSTFEKRSDLYVLFVEQGFNLLKPYGKISYIMPNKWLQAGYGKPLRQLFLRQNLQQLIDFGDVQIFEGATTYPCIFIAEKNAPSDIMQVAVLRTSKQHDFAQNVADNLQIFQAAAFGENTWVISSSGEKQLLGKLKNQFGSLKDFIQGEAYYGVKTGLSEAFFVDEKTKEYLIKQDIKVEEILHPMLQGRDLLRYGTPEISNYLIGTFPALELNIDDYSSIKNHLLQFDKRKLEQSGTSFENENGEKIKSRKKTKNQWFETQDTVAYHHIFKQPKIMYQTFQVKPCFIYDEQNLFCNNSVWVISTNNKGLLAILNSKMGWWLIGKYCTQIQNGYQLIWEYFNQIPIAEPTPELAELADKMIQLNRDFQAACQQFLRLICRRFALENPNKALQSWHELKFAEFTAALKKHKITLSLADEMAWEDTFQKQKDKVTALQSQIAATDREIDRRVFALYGLTDDEIALVQAGTARSANN